MALAGIAVDFLQKPFTEKALFKAINLFATDRAIINSRRQWDRLWRTKHASLQPRERFIVEPLSATYFGVRYWTKGESGGAKDLL